MTIPRLSLNDWTVLAVVAEQPRHGFAVARELQGDAPLGAIWRVAKPQVYRSLDRLTATGLAQAGPAEHGDGPERHVIAPTPRGRRAVTAWATEPVDRLRLLRSALLVKLVVCRRLGLDGPALLDRQREVVASIDDALDHALASIPATDDRRVALLWRKSSAAAAVHFLTAAHDWWDTNRN